MEKYEKSKIIEALIYPVLFIAVISLVHIIQFVFDLDFHSFGVYPRKLKGLWGILFSPFLHGDYKHLFNNSVPLLILGGLLFYSYKKVALRVVFWVFLMSGVWTWVSAREAYHIGASGLVYGLFSFLLFSGFIRKHTQLIALSLFVVMVYGGMVWGIFPIKVEISFEGHFWGFLAGIVLAFYFKKEGTQRKVYVWDEDDEDEDDDDNAYWKIDEPKSEHKPRKTIHYIFKPKKPQEKK